MSQLAITFTPPKLEFKAEAPALEVSTGLPVVKEYIDVPAYNEIVRPVTEVDA